MRSLSMYKLVVRKYPGLAISIMAYVAARTRLSPIARAFSPSARRLTIRTTSRRRYTRPCVPNCGNVRHVPCASVAPRLTSTKDSSVSNEHQLHNDVGDIAGLSVKEVLDSSKTWLESQGAPEPESSVVHLLANALELPWKSGFAELELVLRGASSNPSISSRRLTQDQSSLYKEMLQRRARMEPLQYILQQWDFLDYTLKIVPPLLCPRPETEELVLSVIEDAKSVMGNGLERKLRVLDVGCGTGAIGIALAHILRECEVVAIDVEPIAVSTSKENARSVLAGASFTGYEAVLASAADYKNDGAPFDVVVSNPPYIPQHDMEFLTDDVVRYESWQALCGGMDGMDVVRDIIDKLSEWSKPGGVLWMEVNPTHPHLLKEWLDEEGAALGVAFDSVHEDMYGRDRFVKLTVL